MQVQGLLLQLAKDHSQDVVDAAFEQVLPAVLAWTGDSDLLYTALLPAILADIRASLERSSLFQVANLKQKHMPVCYMSCCVPCSLTLRYKHCHPPQSSLCDLSKLTVCS